MWPECEMYINSPVFLERSRDSSEYQFMQIKDVPRWICFFRRRAFLSHLGCPLLSKTVRYLKCGCVFVDINHFSSAMKVKICELTCLKVFPFDMFLRRSRSYFNLYLFRNVKPDSVQLVHFFFEMQKNSYTFKTIIAFSHKAEFYLVLLLLLSGILEESYTIRPLLIKSNILV